MQRSSGRSLYFIDYILLHQSAWSVLKTIGDICSLGGVEPGKAWAVASGQGAKAFGSDGNVIAAGAVADLVVMDASLGSVTGWCGCGARCAR